MEADVSLGDQLLLGPTHIKVCLCSNYKADASTAILNNLNYQLNKFD